jgi:hypothetical protein
MSKRSAQHFLAAKKSGHADARKAATPLEIVNKIVHLDFTYAMVNYKTSYCVPDDS